MDSGSEFILSNLTCIYGLGQGIHFRDQALLRNQLGQDKYIIFYSKHYFH